MHRSKGHRMPEFLLSSTSVEQKANEELQQLALIFLPREELKTKNHQTAGEDTNWFLKYISDLF